MYAAGPSKNYYLDNILPHQKQGNKDPPIVGSLLSDLQNGIEWSLRTTPTDDGGYCINFKSNRPRVNKSQMMDSSPHQTDCVKTTKSKEAQASTSDIYYMNSGEAPQIAASTTQLNSKEQKYPVKPQKYDRFMPRKAESCATAGIKKPEKSVSAQVQTLVKQMTGFRSDEVVAVPSEAAEISQMGLSNMDLDFGSNIAEIDNEAQAEMVAEALDNQKDSGRPAMLVCVLLGPSMDLMKISNAVQLMAKEHGVTVRMNAPMH